MQAENPGRCDRAALEVQNLSLQLQAETGPQKRGSLSAPPENSCGRINNGTFVLVLQPEVRHGTDP
jgi:hypothetical protein